MRTSETSLRRAGVLDGLELTSDFRARDWGWRRTDFDKGDVGIEIKRHGKREGEE